MKHSRTCGLLATALMLVVSACSDSATTPSSPLIRASGGPSRIVTPIFLASVTPLTATVAAGGTQQFTAVNNSGATMGALAVTWNVIGVGTIDANGLYTAGTTAGTDTVTVFDNNFPAANTLKTAIVTVTAASTCKPHDDRKKCENEGDHGGKDHGGNRHHDRGHGGKNADQGHGGKNGDGKGQGHGG